jgi:hypothetical protein
MKERVTTDQLCWSWSLNPKESEMKEMDVSEFERRMKMSEEKKTRLPPLKAKYSVVI